MVLGGSGGLSIPGQEPFGPQCPQGDPSFRVIPGPGPLRAWRTDHGHYDPRSASEDYNTVFPLDALVYLAESGVVGSVVWRHISFVGYPPDPRPFVATSAPAIVDLLRDERVAAALLVPV